MKACLKLGICLLFLVLGHSFLVSPTFATTETTLYLGSVEKILEKGETKVYYRAGTVSVVRTSKPDGSSQVSYLHPDHLGSTVLITEAGSGKMETGSDAKYYPYGKEIANLSQTTDKLYTGQRKDTSSDLYFYNARYYNPTTAHFVSVDKAEGGNRYAYVGNNPVMRNDPSGNMAEQGGGGGFGYDIGKVMAKYSNQIAFGTMAQMLADLRIPLISDIAGEYSLGIQQYIRGELTNDTILKTQGFTHATNAFVGAYMLGTTAYGVYETGVATKQYYSLPSSPVINTKVQNSDYDFLQYVSSEMRPASRMAVAGMLRRWAGRGLRVQFANEGEFSAGATKTRFSERTLTAGELTKYIPGSSTIEGSVTWNFGGTPVLKVPPGGIDASAALHEMVHVRDAIRYNGLLTQEIREITEAAAYKVTDVGIRKMQDAIMQRVRESNQKGVNHFNPWF